MQSQLKVSGLFIYPIKSLGGISLDSIEVQEAGFKYDRRWMLVDQNGMFITQRKHPKLALLKTKLEHDGLVVSQKDDPNHKLKINFSDQAIAKKRVVIWDDEVESDLLSPEYSKWFSAFLGFQVDLVKMPKDGQRPVDPKYAEKRENVSFADGMPYLIIGEEALNDLNGRLEKPVPMDRFRPNIVFSGGSAFEEDSWSYVRIGGVKFKVVKPCARCVLTTVNQDTGQTGKEPLKTLSTYRNFGNKVLFGQNALALESGKVSVGDQIIKHDQ
ncbi:MOSC domain-containing protein [Algoriphagus sediminis]|uniref:MOSC domain-containing protein n=1 Tax=Algoriphagus sediminis TaxID=3057113 RepID=A0ABT7Y9D1_9BACT|nr:MOSC domain-containing protein [Algoriphagus sediminis]MDN3203117.1 MOSC domain-containing protein [Algoriphagus sediminis]